MKKTILIGTILAVTGLLLMSFTSTTYAQTSSYEKPTKNGIQNLIELLLAIIIDFGLEALFCTLLILFALFGYEHHLGDILKFWGS